MLKNNDNRIFLCHANEDKEIVLSIFKKLKESGFNPWLDKINLLPGENWEQVIIKTIKSSRFFLPCFSKKSVSKRGFVQREYKLGLYTALEIPEDEIFIIPVRLDDCEVPEGFKHLHYIDLFEKEGIVKVMASIKVALNGPIIYSTFNDSRDNQVYKTIEVNGKIWMAENLNFDIGEGCWLYNNDIINAKKYGRLYDWDGAINACPSGWRLPTIYDWDELVYGFGGNYEGRVANPRKAFKDLIDNGSSGFNANLGGYITLDGEFIEIEKSGSYWSSTEHHLGRAWRYFFYTMYGNKLSKKDNSKGYGFSCRYIKN